MILLVVGSRRNRQPLKSFHHLNTFYGDDHDSLIFSWSNNDWDNEENECTSSLGPSWLLHLLETHRCTKRWWRALWKEDVEKSGIRHDDGNGILTEWVIMTHFERQSRSAALKNSCWLIDSSFEYLVYYLMSKTNPLVIESQIKSLDYVNRIKCNDDTLLSDDQQPSDQTTPCHDGTLITTGKNYDHKMMMRSINSLIWHFN